MSDLYNLDSYSTTINFISGIFWIPYTLFLFYLFFEHHVREKFPQNLIILLLALGAVFRTVWFLGYRQYQSTLGFLIINRIAILLQFTALSVLILMWMRALKITQIAYSKQPSPLLLSSSSSAFNNSNTNSSQSSSRKELSPNSRSPSTNTITSHNTNNTISTRITTQTSRQALMFKQVEAQFQQLVRYVSVVVFLVWCVILLSLIGDADQKQQNSRHFFNANIIMISSLCLLEAIFTLVVGVRTALALQKELAPVFVSNNNNNNNYKKGGTRLHPSRHALKVSTSNNDLSTRDSAVNNNNVVTNTNSNNNSNNNSYHDERLISTASDTAEVWHRVSRCCQWITCYDDCLGLRSLMNLYRLFFTKSQSALGLQLQRDVLRSLLTVSLIVFVFFFLRALGYLYRFIEAPVTPPNVHNAIGEIWYPLFFYQFPELIPNLAIAAGISPPNGVLKRFLFCLYNTLCCMWQPSYNTNSSASSSVTTVSRTTPRHARHINHSRQQNVSVSSSNTFLSSLTGGPTVSSMHSGVSATPVSQQQSQALATIEENDHHNNNNNEINYYKNSTKFKNNNKSNIIMNNNSNFNTSNPGSSVATSHTSDDHNLQQLQLPFHLQQQLHLAQQVYQSSPQFSDSNAAYMNQNVQNPMNDHISIPSETSDNHKVSDNENENVRDSESSQLSTVMSRVSETRLSQQHKQKTKSSFSIASSPMNNNNNNNNLANYFNNNNNNVNNNKEVLMDDVADDEEEINVDNHATTISSKTNTNNINKFNSIVSGSQSSVSAWSPLTGTSAASSYQQSHSQQSTNRTLSNFSANNRYIHNNSNNNNTNNSQSQQRSSLISMFFHRTSSNNNNTTTTNMVGVSPAVSSLASGALTHRTDDNHNNNHKTMMRQESTDYEELLYRLNSYLPERLHSSDALYHGFNDFSEPSTPYRHPHVHNVEDNDYNNIENNYFVDNNNHENTHYSDSAEREHALAMYLAPKSRWTRSLPEEDVSALNNEDIQSASPSKKWYLYGNSSNNSVQSGKINLHPPAPAMDEEVGVCSDYAPPSYINNDDNINNHDHEDEGSESSSQRKSPHKQSARSKSWLDKVMR